MGHALAVGRRKSAIVYGPPAVADLGLADLARAGRARSGGAESLNASSAAGPPSAGWLVTQQNVGLAAVGLVGANLPLYTGSTTPAAGAVIDGYRIESGMSFANSTRSNRVTVRNCLFYPTSSFAGDLLDCGNENVDRFPLIEDCDVDMSRVSAQNKAYNFWLRGGSYEVKRINVINCGNGMWSGGSGSLNPSWLIEHVWQRNMTGFGAEPNNSHTDGWTNRAGSGGIVRYCNIYSQVSQGTTGDLFIQTTFGNVQKCRFEANLLDGPYCFVIEDTAGGNITAMPEAVNNRLGSGSVGYNSGTAGTFAVWTDNYRYANDSGNDYRGAVVAKPF